MQKCFTQSFENLTVSLPRSLTRFTYKNATDSVLLHLMYARSVQPRNSALLTHRFKLKPLKTNENCKGSLTLCRLEFYERKRDRERPSGCVGEKGTRRHAHLRQPRFTLFRTRVFHATHVSTNIPRKLGGMKSFAPFWTSRCRDERFVELTRKIFPSYRGAAAMKNRMSFRHTSVAPRKIIPPIADFSFAEFAFFSAETYKIVAI